MGPCKIKFLLIVLLAVFTLNSCTYVEQHYDEDCRGLTPSGKAVVTIVWYKGDVIKSWYDDVNGINDSLITLRQQKGDSILATLKRLR